jgi:hypothetical protein
MAFRDLGGIGAKPGKSAPPTLQDQCERGAPRSPWTLRPGAHRP